MGPADHHGAPQVRGTAGVDPWMNVSVGVGPRVVAYLWEWEGDRPRRLRVLRSRRGFAESADDAWQGAAGQFTVYEGEGTSLRDAGLAPLTDYCYTFFVREGAGEWRELLRERLTTPADDAPPRGKALLGDDGISGDDALAVIGLLGDVGRLILP